MRRIFRIATQLFIAIGGIGCFFKGLFWTLNQIGLFQTSIDVLKERHAIMRWLIIVSQSVWPLIAFCIGVFVLACIHYGSPKAWFSKWLTPNKYRIFFSAGKNVEGCVVPDHRGIWSRVKLESSGASVGELEASILRLWEDGERVEIYGEFLVLQMRGCETRQQKLITIREGRPEFINITLTPNESLDSCLTLKEYHGSVGDKVYLKPDRLYEMEGVLNCDNSHPSVPFKVEFKRTSEKDTAVFSVTQL